MSTIPISNFSPNQQNQIQQMRFTVNADGNASDISAKDMVSYLTDEKGILGVEFLNILSILTQIYISDPGNNPFNDNATAMSGEVAANPSTPESVKKALPKFWSKMKAALDVISGKKTLIESGIKLELVNIHHNPQSQRVFTSLGLGFSKTQDGRIKLELNPRFCTVVHRDANGNESPQDPANIILDPKKVDSISIEQNGWNFVVKIKNKDDTTESYIIAPSTWDKDNPGSPPWIPGTRQINR